MGLFTQDVSLLSNQVTLISKGQMVWIMDHWLKKNFSYSEASYRTLGSLVWGSPGGVQMWGWIQVVQLRQKAFKTI